MLRQILVLCLLMLIVQGQVISQGNIIQWCSLQNNPFLQATDQTASSAMDFDFTSTIYTDERESAPLYVKQGSATTPFIFKTYSSTGVLQTERKCTGSQSFTYYSLLKEFLILTKNDMTFYVCKYLKDTDSALVPLSTTITSFVIVDFSPYMVHGNTLYVLVSTTTTSKIINYMWNATATPSTPFVISNQSPVYSTAVLTPPIGGHMFLYNKISNSFLKLSSNTWTSTSWVADTVLTNAVIGTQTVAAYHLREQRVVITLTNPTTGSGSIYTAFQIVATLQLSYTTTNINIQDFTDNQHNFIRAYFEGLIWLTMRSTENAFAFIKSTITTTELNFTGRGLAAANIFTIGLSQNKATIMYDNGKIDILRHDAQGNVKLLFSNSVTGNPVLNVNQNKQYVIKLNCTCEAVKKHVCFSQTLNCVIINKAASSCNKNVAITSW